MVLRSFHHPDFNVEVAMRTAGQELLELVGAMCEILTKPGLSQVFGRSCFPSQRGYEASVYRLRRNGLIASVIPGKHGLLRLTDEGRKRIPDYFRPERFWSRRWDGRWYLLLYDVPERFRAYRKTLQTFLQRHRLGNLQRSVWITPDDLRPLYVDLRTAAGFRDYGLVMEAQTVMRERSEDLVFEAWDMDRLHGTQAHFCQVCTEHLDALEQDPDLHQDHRERVREELSAFASAMAFDPLLPADLLPSDYLGKHAVELHRRWIAAIR